jgi:hypothetical protein
VRSLALGMLVALVAACHQPAPPAELLRAGGQYGSCDADLRDASCVACLKRSCCREATACTATRCPCAFDCLKKGNDKACGATCAAPEDRAIAACTATTCAAACGGAP